MVRVVQGGRKHSVTSCEGFFFFFLLYKGFISSPPPPCIFSALALNQKQVMLVWAVEAILYCVVNLASYKL